MIDKEILERFLNHKIQLVNDENFVKEGTITGVFKNSISFLSNGKTYFLSFNRIKEIRPTGE